MKPGIAERQKRRWAGITVGQASPDLRDEYTYDELAMFSDVAMWMCYTFGSRALDGIQGGGTSRRTVRPKAE